MERRVLLAIFLSFLVIYIWQGVFFKPAPKSVSGSATSAAATEPGKVTPAPAAPAAVQAAQERAVAKQASSIVGESSERDIRVETTEVIAVFTNRGGRLKSWRLKSYRDAQGEPLELVAQNLPDSQPRPFSLRVPDADVTDRLNQALYSVSGAPSSSPQTTPVQLRFEYEDNSGLRVTKDFQLEPDSFVLSFASTVKIAGKALTPTVQWGPGLGDTEETSRSAQPPGGLFSAQGSEQRLTPAAIVKQPGYQGSYEFVGVDDHYFVTMALNTGAATVTFDSWTVPQPPESKAPAHTLVGYSIDLPPGDQPVKFYVGPKDFDRLASVGPNLTRAINFGWFTVIVVPLLRSLKWINGYVGNYGWSILALTAIINLIILPLRHKSVVSMRKMQEIQPEAKAIQDRYAKLKATDPAKQKMNQELMELYRARGVNPAGGCVPMLLPFPILFAFYSLLSKAIELRGAPFMLWIHDLSKPDPYYVTPILMGLSQLWQQWIAPATGVDPIQRRMMMVMPVVFTFLFITYPSGVALYWLASNLWAIGQQYGTNYVIGPPNIRNVRPAAERRVKRVGSGKTDAAAAQES